MPEPLAVAYGPTRHLWHRGRGGLARRAARASRRQGSGRWRLGTPALSLGTPNPSKGTQGRNQHTGWDGGLCGAILPPNAARILAA